LTRGDSELRALAGRFPLWEAWRGASGMFYARRRGTTDEPVRGESVEDLADAMTRDEALRVFPPDPGPAPGG
jgi:hypothetical protein